MKLYTAQLSPFAARCRMQIYAKQLSVEFVEAGSGVSKEQICSMNPMGKIPVLEDEGTFVAESEVICEYLEERFPGTPLLPADPRDRARVRLLNRVADLYVFAPLAPLFAHLSRKRRDPLVVERQCAEIEDGLRCLDALTGESGYAVGDSLSLADCGIVPILLFVNTYLPYFDRQEPLGDHPRLNAYWPRIGGEPHAARVIAEIRAAVAAKSGG